MPSASRAVGGGYVIEGLEKDTPSLSKDEPGDSRSIPKSLTESGEISEAEASLPVRELSRVLARRTSEKDRKKLYAERADLVTKEFLSGLTPEETGRLGSLTWILAQIQEADWGPAVDTLEQVAELLGRHGRDLERFVADIEGARPNREHFFPAKTRDTKRKKK